MEKPWASDWRNSPGNEDSHYEGDIQPIEYFASDFHESMSANVIKYVDRHQRKGGKLDLEKARWYVDWLERSLDHPEIHAGDYIAANDFDESVKEIILLIERFEELRYDNEKQAKAILRVIDSHIVDLINENYE